MRFAQGLISMGLRNSVFWLAHGLTYLLVQMRFNYMYVDDGTIQLIIL